MGGGQSDRMEIVLSGNLVNKGGKTQVTGEGAGSEGGPSFQRGPESGVWRQKRRLGQGSTRPMSWRSKTVLSPAVCRLLLSCGQFQFPSCGNRIRC